MRSAALRTLAVSALPAAVLSGAMFDTAAAAELTTRDETRAGIVTASTVTAPAAGLHSALPHVVAVTPSSGAVLRGAVTVQVVVDCAAETHTSIALTQAGQWRTDATMEVDAEIHGAAPYMRFDSERFDDGAYEIHVATIAAGGATATRTHGVRIDNARALTRRESPTSPCHILLQRSDGSIVADHHIDAPAAALRHLDNARWELPDGVYVMTLAD